ncbi:MAG TPA: hypothetical protein VLI88_03505 [Patescibacteria group bacterium]|jgi:hypothetical protein|nr:hypothetical protein [Patescibacteria group bacterium]
MDHQQLALAVRFLHVAAMATAFGGALLVTWLAWRLPPARIVDVAVRYEQLFWLAVGVLVMTGVGNLGAFGDALPAPASGWGRTFIAKLVLITALLIVSLPRSLAVVRMAATPASGAGVRSIYTATSGLLAGIVALALELAHG